MPGVAFVVNGSLVRGSGRLLTLCREAAARHGWRPEFLVTEKAEAGVSAANSAALDGIDLVVAVGGDGTVRGCAEGLARTGVPLGIVPQGTANLLARTLGVPGHPRAALAAALCSGGADRTIDLAVADEVPFTAMAGMGLDAAVVAGTRLKHQFGWLAYAVSGAARALPRRAARRLAGRRAAG
jgi:diacylglycerol kinase (ATP)